ncbi:MAG TPA: HD domain-containing phosphohydrolase [Candidatus Limnocylindrales bacterium]|nr:HD domain-containing phosphohydrolase [Candidatus Limnocylindrales bacterium]
MRAARPSGRWAQAVRQAPGQLALAARLATGRPTVMLAVVAAIVALSALAYLIVRVTGGSPSPLNHLSYAPILLGAYFFGWRGGAATGLLAAFVMGPLAGYIPDGGSVEQADAWATRGAFYIAVGTVVGLLFDRSRTAESRWRGAALQVIEREREGMTALARGVAAKDGHTGDHVTRVQTLSEDLALAVGFSRSVAHEIGWSAMLHDVGKLHVPDAVLLKPGPLDEEEWLIIRQHSAWGAEILANGAGFELARRIARWHHENFDGSGYPDGLRGERIPLEARLVRIVDAFDAMTHRRPYHDPRTFDWAIEELKRCSGRHFDPELLGLFVDLATSGRLETVNRELASGATRREHAGAIVLPSSD